MGRALGRLRGAAVVAGILFAASTAEGTLYYGDIQISGNVETQNLFRIQNGENTFSAFNPVQQRNTFRLEWSQKLIQRGTLLDRWQIPWIESGEFFAYYRFVYDSIYDIAPGPFLETQGGSMAGKISDFTARERKAMAFENKIREVFLDLKIEHWPIRLRIGRQQIVWGEAIAFRGLDSANALDLTWHLQQEAGLFGRVGWSELRKPGWAVKMTANLPSFGRFSNLFVEAYDIPFDFQVAEARLLPAPWSVPVRNPFRGGLVVDAGEVVGLPGGVLLVQPCFDATGTTLSNSEADPDFSETAETGFCNSQGLQVSTVRQGLYERRDPADVNQFGVRLGGVAPLGIEFSLNFHYRRHLGADIPGATVAKAQIGALTARPQDFVALSPHETTDPITRETTTVLGFLRTPIEFYNPYVPVTGVSLNYFDDFTKTVFRGEAAWTHGVPTATLEQTGNGIRRQEHVVGAVAFDRPTWIRWLNRKTTFFMVGQLNFLWLPEHEGVVLDADGNAIDGDVGAPNSGLIPEAFGSVEERSGVDAFDRVKGLELISVFVLATFYKGGSVAPVLGWINDWSNAPSMEFILSVDYLPTPNITLSPALRIITNFGRLVDDPWGAGRTSQWDELQLKMTYQF